MAEELKIRVNEEESTVAADRETPLLYVLSNELGLQGPRFGCGLAQCGSCSVLLDGAPQCGYCYNGMIIKGFELLSQNQEPSEREIREAMNGHLCRCGSYPRIMKAIQLASRIMAEERR